MKRLFVKAEFPSRKWRAESAVLLLLLSLQWRANAQQNQSAPVQPKISVEARTGQTNQAKRSPELEQRAEKIRTVCVRGRRMICGKIIQIQPDGLVIESGYTNLLRPSLAKFWLIPGNVSASRNPNEIESSDPGSLCVGRIFLTDIPKKPTPNLYDYVVLQAYPAGQYIYQPVTNVQKTIRRFSVGLETAAELSIQAGEK